MTDLLKKMEAFNKRWKTIDNSSYQEEFEKFKTRVMNSLENIDSWISDYAESQFLRIFAIPVGYKAIYYSLKQQRDEKKFYQMLEILFSLPFKDAFVALRGGVVAELMDSLTFSKVNLAVKLLNGELIFYPRGEKELDVKLVDEVISFLDDNSKKHFIQALKFYENSSKAAAVKSAESLRRSLEEFLRYKLGNEKGLDANISELAKQLKADGRDSIIRNIIVQIFSYLDKYFNENSKHKDGEIDKVENEFLIYQTGVLLRYIDNIL